MRKVPFVLCVLLVCAPACFADLYWQSSFNNDRVKESAIPAMWTWANEPKPSIVDAVSEGVTLGTPD